MPTIHRFHSAVASGSTMYVTSVTSSGKFFVDEAGAIRLVPFTVDASEGSVARQARAALGAATGVAVPDDAKAYSAREDVAVIWNAPVPSEMQRRLPSIQDGDERQQAVFDAYVRTWHAHDVGRLGGAALASASAVVSLGELRARATSAEILKLLHQMSFVFAHLESARALELEPPEDRKNKMVKAYTEALRILK